ncbi:peptidoglycan DD-metalloendopeptidase family protein [Nitrosomonas sp. Nm166]|uniref:peptidoglycan DD-metalloendopeptidase family protein n=1 Tax=Nitrosomonas sp. Nm166 TaxID=1881054 RepID=UPI00210995CD|nr:peptidoglycan DD-metalloendopeptidase family protein [Nitrosomonas sp. Nm166]
MIGCSTTQPPVPVVDRSKADVVGPINKSIEPASSSSYNQFYIVQKGDTLYSIALNHGIDFKKLAEWNHITDPKNIKPGQRISLSVPLSAPASDSQPVLFALPQQPIETTLEPNEQPFATIPQESDRGSEVKGNLKTSPKAIKLPFSEQNVARLKDSANLSSVVQTQPPPPALEKNTRIEVAPQPESQQSDAEWMWPTTGKLLSSFSKNSKGVKISGQAGQPILASAAGEVVYSGHGLRGYGNLIIIKHNNTFLSAYAHNSKILVKEGEAVVKGQKIAEMGNTDSDTIQLHFEIRKHGKPVDPLEYLPNPS